MFLSVEKILSVEFVGLFSRQSLSRGINKMAASDGSSARDMLRQILGRIGDLSAEIDEQGSSSSKVTTPQTTTSLESEIRNVFFAGQQGNQARTAMPEILTLPRNNNGNGPSLMRIPEELFSFSC